MGMNNTGRQNSFSREKMQENMPSIVSSIFDKVTWDANGQELVFNRTVLKDPIKVELVTNDANELGIEVKIPLKELRLPSEQNYFSIGFATNKISAGMAGRPIGGMNSGSMQPRGGRGTGGNQRPGGAGGHAGGKSGRSYDMSKNSSTVVTPINIWFKVEL